MHRRSAPPPRFLSHRTATRRASKLNGFSAPRLASRHQLADARQRVADEHVDDPAAAETRVEEDEALGLGAHLADDRRLGAERVRPQRGERVVGGLGGDDGDELALVRDVERVDAEDLAGADDRGPERQRRLVEEDGDALPPARAR